MEYALLKFNEELKVNINGTDFIPAVSYYPELWNLYMMRLELRSDYLVEIISSLKEAEYDCS